MISKLLKATIILTALLMIPILPTGADIGNAERVKFGRYPSPSPDGTMLAFSWNGDLWKVPIDGGRATRLTSSDGYDWNPIWSPDGSKIAFNSDRYGSEDLFVIDADGGTPFQVTFSSNGDILSGWLPDMSGLAFSTRRGGTWPNYRQPSVVYFEDLRGYGPSAPKSIVECQGYQAVFHPDGDLIAFHSGPGNGYRQGYRGTHKEDIWLYRISTGEFTRITNNDTDNTDPQWSADGTSLYYRSEEGSVGNLWVYDLDTGSRWNSTLLDTVSLWNPKVGGPAGNEIVAYEWLGEIWVQNIAEGNPHRIDIYAWLDEDPDTPSTINMTAGATEFAISPDGNEMAVVVRGEIFCVRTDGIGGTTAKRLTNHPARDWEISWYPRGDSLLFTSDRDGIEQLYRVVSDDPDNERLSESRRFRIERLLRSDMPCSNAVIAPVNPDFEGLPSYEELTVAYVRGNSDLWLMAGNGDGNRMLYSHWGTLDYAFSPDGRWIAYSRQDNDYNVDIFIAATDPDDPDLPACPSDGWQPFPGNDRPRGIVPSWHDGEVNITRHPDDDYSPVWSPDGSKIGFTSVRNMDNVDVYFLFLKQEDEERSLMEWEVDANPLPDLPVNETDETEEEPQDEEIEEECEEASETEEETDFLVDIDFEDIQYRSHRLTSDIANEFLHAISPDGEDFIYTSDSPGNMGIWQTRWSGENNRSIVGNVYPSLIEWVASSDRIYYQAGSRISSVRPGGGNGETHNYSGSIEHDPLAARMYKFDEVWRIEDNWFYDSEFHGADWDAIGEEYRPIVEASRHYRDLNDAMNMMLGRLNASHLSYRDSERGPSGPDTGYLGCGFIEDDQPGLVIDWITPGSPFDRVEFELNTGDRIVSINGMDVGGYGENPVGNWWRAMEGTTGVEIEIGVIDSESETTDVRWLRVTPVSYSEWWGYAYEEFLAENRRRVEELSGGRLGYMHIRRMYEEQVERFEQDLYTVGHGKDGIIIDVRWNSGGWTTDYLLTILNTQRHALTEPRDGGLGYPEDRTLIYTTDIPLVVLCNEYSYSNAEIFSHAIQTLGRGLLVGWPTAGGVISMGGTSLADGSYISLPRRGWWVIDPVTLEPIYNMEHNGAVPEVMVELTPPEIARNRDPQIDAAVETLMKQLGILP